MAIASYLDLLHFKARQNKWLARFALFNRLALAAGFIPSGFVKIAGERFTALSNNHPMGSYLEALFHTGYYYPFIGAIQLLAAILLLLPRTATLGAVLYFPIILNICILSLSVRFDGSLLSSPLMVLANLYLLCWDYHKLKFIFPFKRLPNATRLPTKEEQNNRFPFAFFGGVALTVLIVAFSLSTVYEIKPRNSLKECKSQCKESSKPEACQSFCACIHTQGNALNTCLDEYKIRE